MSVLDPIRQFAQSLPEVDSGDSCVNVAYKTGKKNFLFLGEKPEGYVVRLRLKQSLEQAVEVAAREPGIEVATKIGWVTIKRPLDQAPPAELQAWVEESFRVMATKRVQKLLDG